MIQFNIWYFLFFIFLPRILSSFLLLLGSETITLLSEPKYFHYIIEVDPYTSIKLKLVNKFGNFISKLLQRDIALRVSNKLCYNTVAEFVSYKYC